MNGIEIINFARRPVGEVWFLRVTTVSNRYMPITKTAYRRIGTPRDKLIDDLILMISGRINTFMGVTDPEEIWGKWCLIDSGGRRDYLKDTYEHDAGEQRVGLTNLFHYYMDEGAEDGGSISCIITNVNDKYTFEIIPSWLPKDERPPKSFAVRPSEKNNTVTLFVKCVRVKVK